MIRLKLSTLYDQLPLQVVWTCSFVLQLSSAGTVSSCCFPYFSFHSWSLLCLAFNPAMEHTHLPWALQWTLPTQGQMPRCLHAFSFNICTFQSISWSHHYASALMLSFGWCTPQNLGLQALFYAWFDPDLWNSSWRPQISLAHAQHLGQIQVHLPFSIPCLFQLLLPFVKLFFSFPFSNHLLQLLNLLLLLTPQHPPHPLCPRLLLHLQSPSILSPTLPILSVSSR